MVTLDERYVYTKLAPTTLMRELKPGDRMIYWGTTWEVITEPVPSKSGKSYRMIWEVITAPSSSGTYWYTVGSQHAAGSHADTATRRVVHRPRYVIQEDPF